MADGAEVKGHSIEAESEAGEEQDDKERLLPAQIPLATLLER